MLSTTITLAVVLATATFSAVQEQDTGSWVVLNHGREAGRMEVFGRGDSVVVRYRHVDRNRGLFVERHYRLGEDGRVVGAESRPLRPDGGTGERTEWFEIAGDSVRWTRGGSDGAAPAGPGTFYRLGSATPFDEVLLARFLLARPGRSARLLPAGRASLEIVADTVVGTSAGPRRVRLAMIDGVSASPAGIWLDERDALFAGDVGWFIAVRPGAESALSELRSIEVAWREAQAAELSRGLAEPVTGVLVIRNGDLFDSERGVVRERTSVVIRGDRIAEVAPAESLAVPAGATVIDATGKSVVPGLWDMHTHYQLGSQTSGALLQLATGLTTVRDLASDLDVAVSHRDRADAGVLASPRVVLAGFMEGPGAWAGPSEVIVRTEAEAREWVAYYDSHGYRQIKLYNLIHPDLVPTIAAEAGARGMRLSGHVPRGMSVAAAVELGFDEINHAAFLFSTFFPDSLFLPRMRAYSAVAAAVAPAFDVDGREMTQLIELLKRHGTVIDGTFNIWQGGRAALTGQGSPASAAYDRLLRRLYDAGVTLVPGTDNSAGSTYITELELYEHAGIPASEVLRMATIVSARVMHDDAEYGSIEPGKVADIIIVDGRPSDRIADLRNIERVIRAGRVYRPQSLIEAVRRPATAAIPRLTPAASRRPRGLRSATALRHDHPNPVSR